MKTIFVSLFILFSLVNSCESLGCPSHDLALSNGTSFILSSTDIGPQCTIKFTVPQYSSLTVLATYNLTGENKVTIRQSYAYGSRTFEIPNQSESQIWSLAPTNFTIDVNIINPSDNETFTILISNSDITPYNDAGTFEVIQSHSFLIDGTSLPGNSTYTRKNAANQPVSIRTVVFSDLDILQPLMDRILIFDADEFKGSLYDVLVAQNSSLICSATNLRIVNTNSGSIGIFTILVSPQYDLGQTTIQAIAHPDSQFETFSATNGITVIHDLVTPIKGPFSPMVINGFEFRGNGTLTMYAGCVTRNIDALRIATITSDNAKSYSNMLIYGKCRTFVLSQGVATIDKMEGSLISNKFQIGTKGVIMDANYPYINNFSPLMQKFLIQAPDSNTAIGVNYDIAYISPSAEVTIQQDIKAFRSELVNLTNSDSSQVIQLSPSYQQLITLNVPTNSTGCLIRFEVVKSSSMSSMFLIFVGFLIYMYN